jgi:hypothetical protein
MRKIKYSLAAGTVGILLVGVSNIAAADLVYDAAILASAQGFGNAPRDLTLQATGNGVLPESGAVGVNSSGAIVFGVPIADSSVSDGNGITNMSGTADLPNPLADNQKYGIPTIGSLGITAANQIAVLFNGTESAGNALDVTDLTLKFYTSSGTLLGAIDGQQSFPDTNAGNGVAGFTFVVSQDEQAIVNGWMGLGGTGTTLALESTIDGTNGGPESYLIYNLATAPIIPGGQNTPEPASIGVLGLGLAALGYVRSKRRKTV